MLSRSPILPTIESLQTILNSVPTPVFLIDRDHRIVMVNDAFCEFVHVAREDVLNTVGHAPDEQREVFWRVDNQVFETGVQNENEEVLTDEDGNLHIIVTRKKLLHLPTPDGDKPFIVASISDVTQIREAEARARYLALHDGLTGLANRAQFNERLAEAIELSRRSETSVGLLLLDLDGFKAINDTYGHAAGDEVLRVVGRRLTSHVRVVDTVARLGGDEFCVVQVGVQQPGGAFALAQRLVNALGQPIVVGSQEFSVSASIGVALTPEDANDAQTLFRGADAALYQVKRAGGGAFLGIGAEGLAPGDDASKIDEDLYAALPERQLSLTYSPLRGVDGSIHGYEALLTWHHPSRGDIASEVFLPVAEKVGLIHEIGAWMLQEACATAATWDATLRVSVNVSPYQLEFGNLPQTVAHALEMAGLPGERLELEMPETALAGEEQHVAGILTALKDLGVRLALDHFGSGSSSIAHLRTFPFDRLKIDESFIASLGTDPRSVAIVSAILHLGQEMDLAITAEGVDGERQAVMLRQMGFSEFQARFPAGPGVPPGADHD
jgi:diguanylate cyclase (GGDEF)-like protein/PAS domain S-box-containing protein